MTQYCAFETKGGWIALVGSDGKLKRSTLPKKTQEEALAAVEAGLQAGAVEDRNAFGDLPDRLTRYFAGEQVDFSDVDIDLSAQGPFHATVQRAAQKIPYGHLVTYRDLARMAGNERAARAAGTAMARNDVPIIVPCHRVVASGSIGGFALGLEWKRTLLRLEGVDI
jgi:methylated-DNA-[protein]-cysteine S-methyltransferase